MDFKITKENLEKKGYKVTCFEKSFDAKKYLTCQISNKTVGIGGSVTVKDIGLYDSLKENNTIYWHWNVPDGKTSLDMIAKSKNAQIYISSANAISQNGEIIKDLTRGSSYVWSATDTTTATGTFATLIFSASTDASAGVYPVTIAYVEAYNNESDVSVNVQNGSVIVNAEECVHDMESISYKAPTCEATGSRLLKCMKCGYSETVTFDKIDCVAENEADCINDAECKYCGDVLESAYGHKYRTQVIDPTTMDEGYTLYTCMRCGDSYQDNILPPVNFRQGYLQAGGPICHLKNEKGIPRACYMTFIKPDTEWIYAGVCFEGKDENQAPVKTLNEKFIHLMGGTL